MNFQTSCMMLVKEEQQQIDLEKWMEGIGWRIRGGRKGGPRFLMADTDENAGLWLELDESAREWFGHDFYDCGDNIEMFKALAAMNNDNDREQWFVAHAVIRFYRLKDTVQTESGARATPFRMIPERFTAPHCRSGQTRTAGTTFAVLTCSIARSTTCQVSPAPVAFSADSAHTSGGGVAFAYSTTCIRNFTKWL